VKRLYIYVFIAIFSFIGVAKTNAQFKDFGLKGGLQINGVLPATEFEDRNGLALSSYMLRGFLRFELSDLFNGEFGVGYAKFSGNDYNNGTYESTGIPIDLRLLITPFDAESLNPYLYLGAGVLHLGLDKAPISVAVQGAGGDDGFYAHFPFGIGTEIKLSDSWLLDVAVGADYTLSERLNGYKIEDFNDAWFNVGVGITYAGESMNSDNDKDGLTKREELELGTDPDNPDTDGDGFKDGEEVNQYKTSPFKADTDGDGLNDGAEVKQHKTDPLKADTDGGSVPDGKEVENGTNPLDPSDDVAPKVVEKELSFDNILFGFDKSKLTKESQATLDAIYDALNKYSEAKITLSGHTDSIGSENYNMKLSEKRANVAKEYLIKKGLNGNLINLEWFGESKPVVPNNTATDRAKNRRTEVKAKVMEKK